ncbi:MAG: polyketide synthase [Chloroflexi bacterium]|nr:MAG: polyketide synthase [Chloroflexota bacterium]
MSGRFPGASDLAQFWQNLSDGVESISSFTADDLIAVGVDAAVMKHPNYVNAAAVVDGIELFDTAFFGYSPREAELIDPQQRLLLECAWEALEDAGYDPDRFAGLIGVYASAGMSRYMFNLYANQKLAALVGAFQIMIGNDKDHASTRLAYKLNLTGPVMTVQTACSSSLVAVCMACDALLNYQCDMALAGGVSINVPQRLGYIYQEGGIASPDGHCRAFDAKARGTVTGNGVGIVLLKRLSDALADGDNIRAVIKGVAVNNDGSSKVGYTAPSINGQAQVIATALSMAQVEPETISYVETHGTGTRLGDPIEVTALTQVFRASTDKKHFCAIGSVKTNIGHLDPAAGIASLIKTVLALEHKMLPPSLHFENPNPEIDFENSPFFVNSTRREWHTNGLPRRAGVSSFGMGGTNAHVVLEEAPPLVGSATARPSQLLVLSARSEAGLAAATERLVNRLQQQPLLNLADVAYTYQVGRRPFAHRRIVVCNDVGEAITKLQTHDARHLFSGVCDGQDRQLVFMFSGQGSQYVNMGRDLYQHDPVFHENVDLCARLLQPHLGCDLREILFPPPERSDAAEHELQQTAMTQPAVFTVAYALAQLWISWGVKPQAMIGHSIGEYVAACLADVFSLDDALAVVAARGRLMQQMPTGSMVAISLPENEVEALLDGDLSLAATNAPLQSVVAGPDEAIAQLERQLDEMGVQYGRLRTSHAFHSKMMEPMLQPFLDEVRRINLRPPQIPYLSNVTGNWITAGEAMDPDYWVTHVRQGVRFTAGIQQLLKEAEPVLLEVGPGTALSSLARMHGNGRFPLVALSSMRHAKDTQSDWSYLLTTMGRLWIAGVIKDWTGLYKNERRQRLSLPTYPFERQRYWIDPPRRGERPVEPAPAAGKVLDVSNWFYVPHWRQAKPAQPVTTQNDLRKTNWLLFADDANLASPLSQRLQQIGAPAVTVVAGEQFAKSGRQHFAVHPERREDYITLLKTLQSAEQFPDVIVHLWSVTPVNQDETGIAGFKHAQRHGFYSLLYLTQALGQLVITRPVRLIVVSNDMQAVTGEESLRPEKATILGACRVIPQEYPNIICRSIDLGFQAGQSQLDNREIEQLIAESMSDEPEPVVAYRGGQRWHQEFEAVSLSGNERNTPLRKGGVYLITGGLGRIGRILARHLAETVQARLVLVGRSAFPAREEWEAWLTTHGEQNETSHIIREIQAMEALGGRVLVASGDVSNIEVMRPIVARAIAEFESINGVVHAAGFTGPASSRSIREITPQECEQHFAPKAHALYVLEEVLAGQPLDFCLLCSSLSSILGGLGFVAYAAANLFMDTYAQKCYHARSLPWTSVNWDGWRFDKKALAKAGLGASLIELAITPEEGTKSFGRVLAVAPQVIVSTAPLQPRIDQWVKLESLRGEKPASEQAPSVSGIRPTLHSTYVAPRTAREETIANLWELLLGIQPIGIYDNFFELGGHSLLAIQLISRLRDTFQIELPVQLLFDGPTVAELTANVEQQVLAVQADKDRITEILELVESLSEEELEALLAEPEG